MKARTCFILLVASLPVVAAPITVTNTNDTGAGSLRDAITQANGTPGADTIEFAVNTGVQTWTAVSGSPLPAITEQVTVDGTTQPGFMGAPLIDLNGNGKDFPCLVINAGGCVIKGLIVRGYGKSSGATVAGNGIEIHGTGGCTVWNCWFGVDSTGARSSNRGDGVFSDSPNNTIRDCIVSGNSSTSVNSVFVGGSGIHLVGANGTSIFGCRVGTNPAGTSAVGNNSAGIWVENSNNTNIGSGTAGEGNQISGQGSADGVKITGTSSGTKVRGCNIGLNAAGNAKLGNNNGIRNESPNTTVGGGAAGEACVVSGNGNNGILFFGPGAANGVIQGVIVGLDSTGTMDLGNSSNGIAFTHDTTASGNDGPRGNTVSKCTISGNGDTAASLANGISLVGDTSKIATETTGDNTIIDNNIGTDKTGTVAVGNSNNGISISSSHNNTIGAVGAGNVVASNGNSTALVPTGSGIDLSLFSSGTGIFANFIGTDRTAMLDLGNARSGIHARNGLGIDAGRNNDIGSYTAGEENVIAHNHGNGVTIQAANFFGANSVFDNGGLAIDRIVNGDNEGDVSPNTPGNKSNFPVIHSSTSDVFNNTSVNFTLNGLANTDHTVDLYDATGVVNASGHGDLGHYVASVTIHTDASGNYTGSRDFHGAITNVTSPALTLIASPNSEPEPCEPALNFTPTIVQPPPGTIANFPWVGKAGDPINTSTGEVFGVEAVDLALGGPMPLMFLRYYASKIALDGKVNSALGRNRAHNFDFKLSVSGTSAEVVMASGRVVKFTKTLGKWVQSGRLDRPCQLIESVGTCRFSESAGTMQWVFNATGQLTSIEDGHGNAHTLTYTSGKLTSVSDGLGRSLTLAYTGNQLTGVNDGVRGVTFAYTGSDLTSSTDVRNKTTTYHYDGSGNLTSTDRPAGNTPITQSFTSNKATSQTMRGATTALAYGSGSTVETDPTSATTTHSYSSAGDLSGVTDPSGKTIAIASDTTGRPGSVTDRLGRRTSMTYHALSGKIATMTRADGKIETMTYAARVKNGVSNYDLTKITHPDASTAMWSYDVNGNVLTHTNERGGKTTFTRNTRGQPTKIVTPLGGFITLTYDGNGRLATMQDSDNPGALTTFTYNSLDRLINLAHPGGAQRFMSYTESGRLDVLTDERSMTMDFDYDANDRLTKVTDESAMPANLGWDASDTPSSVTNRRNKTSTRTYNSRGLVSSITDALGHTTTNAYDAHRRLSSVTDATARAFTFGYDDEGRILSMTDPLNHRVGFTRDALGLVRTTTDPLNHTTRFERDVRLRVTAEIDPLGRKTKWTYDKGGAVLSATREGMPVASYVRNLLGELTQVTDAAGGIWKWSYSTMGRLKTMTDPLARVTTLTRDTRNRVTKITYPDASFINVSYDAQSFVTSRVGSDGASVTYGRDANGRVTVVDGVVLTLDAEGNVTRSAQNGLDFDATYDDVGRIATLSYASGNVTVSFGYDDAGRLLTVAQTTPAGPTATFGYDAAGRLTSITRTGAVNTALTLDAAGRTTRIQHAATPALDLNYVFNAANEVTSADIVAPSMPAAPSPSKKTFAFDKAGQLISIAGDVSALPANGVCSYDKRGRLIAQPGATFAWDSLSRLTKITMTGLDDRAFTHNGFGEVVTRTTGPSAAPVSRTRYYYHHALPRSTIVAEADDLSATPKRYYVYTPGGQLLWSIDAGTNAIHYYLPDRTGNVLALTDNTGTVTDSYAFGLYGEPQSRTGTSDQPFRWLGAYGVRTDVLGAPASEIAASLRVHIRARWYDPHTMRFLSRDPHPVDLRNPRSHDRYQYAFGDPATFVDFNGAAPCVADVADSLIAQQYDRARREKKGRSEVLTALAVMAMPEATFRNFKETIDKQRAKNHDPSDPSEMSPEQQMREFREAENMWGWAAFGGLKSQDNYDMRRGGAASESQSGTTDETLAGDGVVATGALQPLSGEWDDAEDEDPSISFFRELNLLLMPVPAWAGPEACPEQPPLSAMGLQLTPNIRVMPGLPTFAPSASEPPDVGTLRSTFTF